MRLDHTENIEELLFDYFEGNLSEEEKKEVKEFIDQQPQYLEDFRAWELSYVKDHTAVDYAFNKSLLKKNFISRNRIYLSIAFLAGIISFLLLKNTLDKENIQSQKKNITPLVVEKEMKTSAQHHTIAENKKIKENTTAIVSEKENIQQIIVPTETSPEETQSHYNTADTMQQKKETEIVATTEQKKKQEKILTKKEQRKLAKQIEYYKQKNKETREQQEFLKGGQPYVVPVNPNGF